jgi:hypothetical protein
MNTSNRTKLTLLVVGLVLVSLAAPAWAYPPDNAAILYYRALLLYAEPKPKVEMWAAIRDVISGKAEPNEKIVQYVKRNRYAINLITTAAEIQKCDWGLDYSEGNSLLLPGLGEYKNLARTLLVDARILEAKGDYKTALSRCMTVYKMARHIGNDLMIIGYLVGMSISSEADECVQGICSKMPPDLQRLNWLRNQLADVDKRPFSLKTAIETDGKSILFDLTVERKGRILSATEITGGMGDTPAKPESKEEERSREERQAFEKMLAERVRGGDEKFLAANRKYWIDHTSQTAEAVELPYAQAFATLRQLENKPERDAAENPDATVAAIFAPACAPVFTQAQRQKNKSNAIRAAVEIYTVKAQTGSLPDALPAGVPKDLFSGKDFEYEKKDDGFILRCRGKDLQDGKLYEYEFKVGR